MSKGPSFRIYRSDAFEWLSTAKACSIHAVVTDPPYGLIEYTEEELEKRKNGNGGIWRLPQAFDGHQRSPVPRFTVLTNADHARIRRFFGHLAVQLNRVLVPGAHVFIASNSLLSHLVSISFVAAGFEKRGEIVRIVKTLRGGDRPKDGHLKFPAISVTPRSCWEPWLLFRKPCEGRVRDNLEKWQTGGLRRPSPDHPFSDLIPSAPARGRERRLASHPSLKPQKFVRQLVHAALPLGKGVLLDPFMGSGAIVAAAEVLGIRSIGIEINTEYFNLAKKAIPELASLKFLADGSLQPVGSGHENTPRSK